MYLSAFTIYHFQRLCSVSDFGGLGSLWVELHAVYCSWHSQITSVTKVFVYG